MPTPTTIDRNRLLAAAKAAKNDEFYTQWADIEREMNAYLEYDPDVFRGKVVLLPCDDPEWTNFTKFFALHFVDFGLKKLISTSYAPDSNPGRSRLPADPVRVRPAPRSTPARPMSNGKKFVLERKDINGDGVINIDDLQWEYLEGDGDFRSPEVTALRDEADIVITNPPFSLFRPFMTWVVEGGRRFSVIGNNNAITYNEVFPHIKANQCGRVHGQQHRHGVRRPEGCEGVASPIGSRPRSSAIRQTTSATTRVSGTRAGSRTSTTVAVTNRCS